MAMTLPLVLAQGRPNGPRYAVALAGWTDIGTKQRRMVGGLCWDDVLRSHDMASGHTHPPDWPDSGIKRAILFSGSEWLGILSDIVRYTPNEVVDGGRHEIWYQGLPLLKSAPFLGIGYGSVEDFFETVRTTTHYSRTSHLHSGHGDFDLTWLPYWVLPYWHYGESTPFGVQNSKSLGANQNNTNAG